MDGLLLFGYIQLLAIGCCLIYLFLKKRKEKKLLMEYLLEEGRKMEETKKVEETKPKINPCELLRNTYNNGLCGIGVEEVLNRLVKIETVDAKLLAYFVEITTYNMNPLHLEEELKNKMISEACKKLVFFCNKEGIEHYMSAKDGFVVFHGYYFGVTCEIPYSVRKRRGIPLKPKERDNFQFGECLNDFGILERVLNKFFKDSSV